MDPNIDQPAFHNFLNLTLRPINLSDANDLMAWATDDRVTKYCTWDTYTSHDQALHYIATQAIPHPWLRAICLDDRVIGAISVMPADGCRGEVGYVLAYDYWGKGIMTRVVEMAAAAAFRELPGLRRLQGVVAVGNKASQRVLEKAGFVMEGVLRKYMVLKGEVVDVVLFSMVVD